MAILNQVLFVEVTLVLKKKRKKKTASPARPGEVEREVVRIVGAEVNAGHEFGDFRKLGEASCFRAVGKKVACTE